MYLFRNKYRLQLREKDHEPKYVQLVGGNVNASIDLETLTVVAGEIPASLKIEVMAWLIHNQAVLMEEWKKWQS